MVAEKRRVVRRHQRDIEKAMRESMKNDRARFSIGRISSNGLLEINRQRLKQEIRLRTHRMSSSRTPGEQANRTRSTKWRNLKNGDVESGFAASDHVIEGEVRMGGQEHFYLETHAAIAVPKGEDGEMEVFCSSQHPHHGQVSSSNP